MADRIGQRLGNYTLTRLLGQGGFAEVYLGEHLYLKSQAAIKILQTRLSSTDDTDSFLQEAQTIARLTHPNIIRVLDFGIDNETPYLVMDYASNGTLRQRHPRGTLVPVPAAISYIKQVADALQYAHDERIIHRDIKPENMLLGRRNEVLLSDFGIALVAQSSRYQGTQDVIGTVAYMSPEQIQGRPRPASDQYSLSIVFYEWLTGDRPFRGSFTELCTQHMFAPPPPLTEKLADISPSIEAVVLRALNKDPHQRFESIRDFAQALEEASGTATTERSTQNKNTARSTLLMPNSTMPGTQGQNPATQLHNLTQYAAQNNAQTAHPTSEPQSPFTGAAGQQDSLNQTNQPGQNNPHATLHSSETSLHTGVDNSSPQAPQVNPGASKLVLPAYNPPYPGAQPGTPQNPRDPRFQVQTPQQQGNQPLRPGQSPYGGYNNAQQPGHPYNNAQRPYPEQEAQRPYQQPQQAAFPPQNQYAQRQDDAMSTNYPPASAQPHRSTQAEAEQPAPAEDWFGFMGAWKWRGLATLIGIILFGFLYDMHITIQGHSYPFSLVIPLFFGGAFGPIAGILVGVIGALLASAFYHTGIPFATIVGGNHTGLTIAFYGLAGLATGLSIIGRRRLPSIGSAIRATFLAVLVVGIMAGYLAYTIYGASRTYTDYFLRRLALPLGMSLLGDIIIAFIVLLVYSICARLINPID
jgi:serine/threonine protein kinase